MKIQHQTHLLAGVGNGPLISTKTNLAVNDDFEFVGSDEDYTGGAR